MSELLRFAAEGNIELTLSHEIIAETWPPFRAAGAPGQTIVIVGRGSGILCHAPTGVVVPLDIDMLAEIVADLPSRVREGSLAAMIDDRQFCGSS